MGGAADFDHVRTIKRLKEAGPPAARFKFGIGFEQGKVAANTSEHAHTFFVQKRAAPGRLGSCQTRHLKGLWAELLSPFSIRFLDLLHSVLVIAAVLNETVGPHRV